MDFGFAGRLNGIMFQPFKMFQPFQLWKQTFGAGFFEQPDLSFSTLRYERTPCAKKMKAETLKRNSVFSFHTSSFPKPLLPSSLSKISKRTAGSSRLSIASAQNSGFSMSLPIVF